MSVPITSTPFVNAAHPPAIPQLPSTISASFVIGSTNDHTEKQQLDLRMRKLYPDLWRSARAQSRQMKEDRQRLASLQAAEPRMMQSESAVSDRMDWVDYSLPIKRDSEQQVSRCWQSHSIAWLQGEADGFQLKAQLFGISDPHNLCIGEVPIFIDGDASVASELLPDYMVNGKPRAVLDFTASPAVNAKCNATVSFACVAPEENSSVNDQIDALLDGGDDAYVYLSPAQMNSWVASRAESASKGLPRYVRLSASPVDRDARARLGGLIAGSMMGLGLLAAGIVQVVRRCRGTAGSEENGTFADLPAHAVPARRETNETTDQRERASSSIEV